MGQGQAKIATSLLQNNYLAFNRMIQSSPQFAKDNWKYDEMKGVSIYWIGVDDDLTITIQREEWPVTSTGVPDRVVGHHYYSLSQPDGSVYHYDADANQFTDPNAKPTETEFIKKWQDLIVSIPVPKTQGKETATNTAKTPADADKPVDITDLVAGIQKQADDYQTQADADKQAVNAADKTASDAKQKLIDAQKVSTEAQRALETAKAKADASLRLAQKAKAELEKVNQTLRQQSDILKKFGQKTQKSQSTETVGDKVGQAIDQGIDQVAPNAQRPVKRVKFQVQVRAQSRAQPQVFDFQPRKTRGRAQY
jgi:hypothetical protein